MTTKPLFTLTFNLICFFFIAYCQESDLAFKARVFENEKNLMNPKSVDGNDETCDKLEKNKLYVIKLGKDHSVGRFYVKLRFNSSRDSENNCAVKFYYKDKKNKLIRLENYQLPEQDTLIFDKEYLNMTIKDFLIRTQEENCAKVCTVSLFEPKEPLSNMAIFGLTMVGVMLLIAFVVLVKSIVKKVKDRKARRTAIEAALTEA